MSARHGLTWLFTGAAVLGIAGFARAQTVPGCGKLDRGYGPFDYNNPTHVREYLPRVENAHFEPEIQRLEDDDDAASIGANLDYVLGAFPNHHQALDLMVRYQLSVEDPPPRGALTLECYFARAEAFRPRDGVVRMLHGNFLFRTGHYEEAKSEYERAVALSPTNVEAHYNFGLLLLELGDYEEALHHAKIAYSSGFPLQGLRRKLESAGYSVEVED